MKKITERKVFDAFSGREVRKSSEPIRAAMRRIDGILFSIDTTEQLIEGTVYFESDHGTTFTVLKGGQLVEADTDPGWSTASNVFLRRKQYL